MARIRSFQPGTKRVVAHPTETDCRYYVLRATGAATLVQLDTSGSDSREMAGKVSQSIQLDREQACELVALLRREFDLD